MNKVDNIAEADPSGFSFDFQVLVDRAGQKQELFRRPLSLSNSIYHTNYTKR
jgi:hypothetical protein